jgi:hypothetical protein
MLSKDNENSEALLANRRFLTDGFVSWLHSLPARSLVISVGRHLVIGKQKNMSEETWVRHG